MWFTWLSVLLLLKHYETYYRKGWMIAGKIETRPLPSGTAPTCTSTCWITSMTMLYETNVDDMDPRLWPHVIDQLLAAGALDAWLTPIIMKKGRPAFTLSALCNKADGDAVRATIFRETTTIGIREVPLTRHVLERSESTVSVEGHAISVKTAYLEGDAINRSVEWDDVVATATALGMAAKDVLAAATASAGQTDGGQTR